MNPCEQDTAPFRLHGTTGCTDCLRAHRRVGERRVPAGRTWAGGALSGLRCAYAGCVHQTLLLVLGVLRGGVANAGVQLYLRWIDRRREVRLAARILIAEVNDAALGLINGPGLDGSPLQNAWRDHRGALTCLGADAWRTVDAAVEFAAHPEMFPERFRTSAPWEPFEVATMALEPQAKLPRALTLAGGRAAADRRYIPRAKPEAARGYPRIPAPEPAAPRPRSSRAPTPRGKCGRSHPG